jgi:ABC-2 type transport system permease protein
MSAGGAVRVEDPATRPSRPAGVRAGWRVVAAKELTDHVTSIRFVIVVMVLALVALVSVNSAADGIRDVASQANQEPQLFLALFTASPSNVPSFLQFIAWIAPLLGIVFGFDAVNGERAEGTLPRLVSQPIHRDDVINGKFASGLAVIVVALIALTTIVGGVGIYRLGIVPSLSEVARLIAWLAFTTIYVAFWLGLASLTSVAMRRAATSAIVALAAWVVVVLFSAVVVGIIAGTPRSDATLEEQIHNERVKEQLTRLSPSGLYDEITSSILEPRLRGSTGIVVARPIDIAVSQPLGFTQSLLIAWPQVVALVALTVICFGGAYILFMKQEIRA